MKAGGLFTALAVLIILGGLVFWSNKHPTTAAKSTASASPRLMADDPKQIDRIRIAKNGSDPIEIAKVSDKWEIVKPTAMPADQDAVGMLAGTFTTLDADRLIDEHPASLNEFGLTNPSEEIDLTLKGGKTQKLLLGSDTPAGTGTYAKLEADPRVYTLPSFTKSGFDKTVNDLRDKRLLTFNQDKLTGVTLAARGGVIDFGKNAQGDWQILKPKPMRADSLQVDDLVRKLKDAKMDVTSAADAKALSTQFAAAEKVGTASATDNTGTQSVEIRKGKDGTYYAKSTAVDGIYKTTNDIGESLGKGVDEYRNKKLFDFAFNDPTKLEINGTTYQKAGDKWMAGSTQYDAGGLQDVIDKLRDLNATRFSEKMAGTQTLTLGVTSGDKHRFEKVTIDKDGDVYDAQREGEPSVYVLDTKSVDDLQKAISGIKPSAAAKPSKK